MKDQLLLLACAAVATWRVSHMLLREAGPFEVFHRARKSLGVVYYEGSRGEQKVAYTKYEITTCIWCLSMWIGGGFAALVYFLPQYALWITLPYVFSAAAVILDHFFGQES